MTNQKNVPPVPQGLRQPRTTSKAQQNTTASSRGDRWQVWSLVRSCPDGHPVRSVWVHPDSVCKTVVVDASGQETITEVRFQHLECHDCGEHIREKYSEKTYVRPWDTMVLDSNGMHGEYQ
jgi:hypothetical protein